MAVTINYQNKKVILTAAADEAEGVFIPAFYRYVGATAAGHQAILQDENGKELFKSEANGANFIDIQPASSKLRTITKMVAQTLASGWIEIYLR